MKGSSYRDRDYAFGEAILSLRLKIGLTQAGLADLLGVSRRAVGDWEAGSSYPKLKPLKKLIALVIEQHAFPVGREAEEVHALWQASHQKVPLDEAWLAALLTPSLATGLTRDLGLADTKREGSSTRSDRQAFLVLPFQATTFVGRVTELAEIDALLRDPACRLLTLVGLGGIGKTRLAFEVATRQMEKFQDGVVFVALTSVGTPNQIVSAIGGSLNLSFSGQSDPREQLIGYLQTRHMLLLLDNFEHLLEGVDLVSEILSAAPHVSMLVTSRERLNLSAEWLFDVRGLSYPSSAERGWNKMDDMTEMAEYSAVQLFVQRATQVQPNLTLSDSTLASIVSICQHVDGMPLAIELAAANVRVLPVKKIEEQIRSNLDALTTTLRDIPPRHRSLRAVFDHSWNLLRKEEQALFGRLSVFRGGCSAAAAVQVAGATVPALMMLVDKSLLHQAGTQPRGHADRTERNTGTITVVEGKSRVVLLEPFREYALEKLAEQGETAALKRAHANYYLRLAEACAVQWDTPTVNSAIKLLEQEHDNILAALRWVRESGETVIGLRFGGALWRFWRGGGYINQGRALLDGLLALDIDQSDTTALTARLRALNGAAWLASDQHDFVRASQLLEQSRALGGALRETEGESHLLLNAARQARAAGQYQEATALLEQALRLLRAQGDRRSSGNAGLGLSLYELALVHREQGHLTKAAALYEECMAFHREIGDREGMTSSLLGLGDVARDQGDATATRKYSEQSLSFFRDLGIKWAIGFALNNLAQAAYLDRDLSQASVLAAESVTLFRDLKDDGGLAEVLVTLGRILQAQGKGMDAYNALTEALRLALVVGPRVMVAAALEGLASVIMDQGKAILTVRLLGPASKLRAQMGTPVRPPDQPALESAVARARLALGVGAFMTMWAEAQELPLEQILRII
jgi:predicted ATPase/transcriptional regulator with XRE-family HTH domain